MIGLDTNILVRYVTQDDPVQSAKATKFIESLSADERGFVALVSIVELVWVLQACYHTSKSAIADMFGSLLQSEELLIEQAELIAQALRRFRSAGQADFADCLIERCAHTAGCRHTVTFDRSAVKGAGMKLLG